MRHGLKVKCRFCKFVTKFVGQLVAHVKLEHKVAYKPHVPTGREASETILKQASCSQRSKQRYDAGYGDGAKVDSHRSSIDPNYRRGHKAGEIS